jgi:hypothetical protein
MADKKLYVIKQTFKSAGKLFEAGSLLEDLSEIGRLAKIRLNEGKVIELTSAEQVDQLDHYFKVRHGGVSLKAQLAERASKGSEGAATEKQQGAKATTPPGTQQKPQQRPQPLSGTQKPNTEKK